MPLRFRILPPPAGPAVPVTPDPWPALAGGALTFELAPDPIEVRVGRQPGSELELPVSSVSLAHARIFRGESLADWWLEDLGSTNGTWLDGTRLRPRRPVVLRAGHRFRVASVEVVFEGWSAETHGDPSTTSIARRMISDLFGASAGDAAVLTVQAGPAHPDRLPLLERDRRYLAGRADSCDLVLPSEHVSREHAAFVRRWDGVFVEDLGSRNGVKVNGQSTSGRTRLADGDRVEVGVTTLGVDDPEDRRLRQLAAAEDDVPAASGRISTPGGSAALAATRMTSGASLRTSLPSSPVMPSAERPDAEDASLVAAATSTRIRRATPRPGALRSTAPDTATTTPTPRRAGARGPNRALVAGVAVTALVLACLGLVILFTRWG